jgi:hypothetical protein
MSDDTTADLFDQEVEVGSVETKDGRKHSSFVPAHWIVRIKSVVGELARIDDGAVSVS